MKGSKLNKPVVGRDAVRSHGREVVFRHDCVQDTRAKLIVMGLEYLLDGLLVQHETPQVAKSGVDEEVEIPRHEASIDDVPSIGALVSHLGALASSQIEQNDLPIDLPPFPLEFPQACIKQPRDVDPVQPADVSLWRDAGVLGDNFRGR